MPGPVVLLTDFGLADPYAGQLRGALLRHAPDAAVVDLCHQVAPHNILQGAFFLKASRSAFPPESIFVCVVDPGVGTSRRLILVHKQEQFFLAPDNGLLSLVLDADGPARAWDVTPASGAPASATFHGRDILAPLAARLVLGAHPRDLGGAVRTGDLARLAAAAPVAAGHRLHASVLHVDRFGNCILNLSISRWGDSLASMASLALAGPAETSLTPVPAYGELPPGRLGLLRGSQGYLELALNQESAASRFGLSPGAPVTLLLALTEET